MWDLCQIKQRGEGMAREMEEVRLARSHGSRKGRLRSIVARLLGEAASEVVRPTKALRGSKEPEGREKGPSPT